MSGASDIQFRFYLGAKLMRMPYGCSERIYRADVLRAWPPTGDHDMRPEAVFRALALSSGGNRPEESYATDERIERDLDGSFKWRQDPMTCDYTFHRKDSACPKCHGRMFTSEREIEPLDLSARGPEAMVETSFSVTTTPCDKHA